MLPFDAITVTTEPTKHIRESANLPPALLELTGTYTDPPHYVLLSL